MKSQVLLLFAVIQLSCVDSNRLLQIDGKPVDGLLITKAQYGTRWPFRLDSLYLFRGEKLDVYVEKEGHIYAVNNIASDKADSGEFGGYQQWKLIVDNPSPEQRKAKEEIELLGLKQWVNHLKRR